MTVELTQTEDGYFEVKNKPSLEELAKYYNDQFYGGDSGKNNYNHGYTEEEIEHKYLPAEETLQFLKQEKGTLFEVGYGEGFMLDYFHKRGWDVTGVDFTDDGLLAFFPELRDKLETGDIYQRLEQEITSGNQYDLVVCNNVLEHVIDPVGLLAKMKAIIKPGGVARIAAPNDGSWLQKEIVKRGYAEKEFWVAYPVHLNYFTVSSLHNIFKRTGWQVMDILGEFPIDMFLLNPDSCYTKDGSKGRQCHFARIAFEMGLWKQGIDKVIAFRKGCADAGVGRDLAAYVTPE